MVAFTFPTQIDPPGPGIWTTNSLLWTCSTAVIYFLKCFDLETRFAFSVLLCFCFSATLDGNFSLAGDTSPWPRCNNSYTLKTYGMDCCEIWCRQSLSPQDELYWHKFGKLWPSTSIYYKTKSLICPKLYYLTCIIKTFALALTFCIWCQLGNQHANTLSWELNRVKIIFKTFLCQHCLCGDVF